MAAEGRPRAGAYADRAHPGCLRALARPEGASGPGARGWVLFGGDPPPGAGPGCAPGEAQEPWGPLRLEVEGAAVRADFSPKGGPADAEGRWDSEGIAWQDGNRWDYLNGEQAPGVPGEEPAQGHFSKLALAPPEELPAREAAPMWHLLLLASAVLAVALPILVWRRRRGRVLARR